MDKRLELTLNKKHLQLANKHMKGCTISLIIKEIQTKTTMRYHFMPSRLSKIKNTENNNCWLDLGQLELSYIAAGSIKWYNPLEVV